MPIADLLLHEKNRRQLAALEKGNMHAVILVGPMGYGKETIAKSWVADILQINQADAHPQVLLIGNTEESIKLDDIKQVKSFLQLKTTGTHSIRRAVIIVDAHAMNDESQNALLKSLEEPPEDTLIILTTAYMQGLKQTIVSRSAVVELLPISKLETTEYFVSHNGALAADVNKAYMVTGGQSGLMTMLLRNADHPLLTAIEDAKALLSYSQFERLAAVDKLTKDRQQASLFLRALVTIAQAGFVTSVASGDGAKQTKWLQIITEGHQAQAAVLANANLKLILTKLFVSI